MAITPHKVASLLVLTLVGGLFTALPVGAQTAGPSVDLQKTTNGADADSAPGPSLAAGDTVTWSYTVTNDGGVPLSDIAVTDDQGVTVSCPGSALAPGEAMTCTGSGFAYPEAYTNMGTVTAMAGDVQVSAGDPSNYTGSLVCPLGGDHVVFIGGTLYNNAAQRRAGPIAVAIPPGVYDVTLTSYDDHSRHTGQNQLVESWSVELSGLGGTSLYTSPNSPDLPENVEIMSWQVGTAALTETALTLDAWHAFPGPGATKNSVTAVCAAFDEVAPSIDVRKQAEGADTRQVVRGSDVVFEIAVTNDGVIDLTNVAASDPDYPQCDSLIGDLAAGASVTYECTVPNVQADFTNTVTATGDTALSGSASDSDPSTIQVLVPAIDIRKQAEGVDQRNVVIGSDVVFELAVTNVGSADLVGVAVTDPDYPQCDSLIGDLAAGASVTYECTVPNVQADFTNTATAAGASTTGEAVADSDPSTVIVTAQPEELIDLELTKTADQTLVAPGDEVVFTITVVNQGPGDASGIEVTDVLPAGLSYVSHSGDGTYAPGSLWTIGSLAAGDTATLTVTVAAGDPGSYVNEAEVTAANETDSDSVPGDGVGDDWDDATVDVVLVGASATIGDTVWLDSDGDGVQDTGEDGIAGVTVTLTNTATSVTTTLVTDANGKYLFAALEAGEYTVAVDVTTAPADHTLTTAGQFTVTLGEGESFLDADFGFQPSGGEELPMTGFPLGTFGITGLLLTALGAALLGTTRRWWHPRLD